MPNALLTGAIDAVASGTDLSEAQAGEVLSEIMHGEVSEIQIEVETLDTGSAPKKRAKRRKKKRAPRPPAKEAEALANVLPLRKKA